MIKVIKNEDSHHSIGHVCKCGKEHKWPMYVFAHYRDRLIHTCDCGVKVEICNGIVEELAGEQP